MNKQLQIEPTNISMSWKQGTIKASYDQIVAILGKPTDRDIDGKVAFQWDYSVNGTPISIWDWKGSHYFNEFSFWGDLAILQLLFGKEAIL